MITFQLASSNSHKLKELSLLLGDKSISVELAPEKLEIIEDGSTYQENAYKKAEGYYKKFQRPVLADDSGLEVSFLPGELGIKSARFGGVGLTSAQQCDLLLEKMTEAEGEQRLAYFICILCFYLSPTEIYFFEGRLDGKIGHKSEGENGFGYDPIFIPLKNKNLETLAMLPKWKEEHSHRAIAAKKAQDFFLRIDSNSLINCQS